MAMAVEAFDAFGQRLWQLFCQHAEATARCTGIVEFCLNLAVLGVDAQAVGYVMLAEVLTDMAEAFVLREGVEGDVPAAMEYVAELILFVSWTIGMSQGAELLEREPRFAKAAGCGMTDVLAEDGEGPPQGKGLEGKDYLYIGSIGNVLD